MSFLSFFRSRRPVLAGRPRVGKRSVPRVEALEERNLPDATSFVNALYATVLSRPASSGEVQAWVAALNGGVAPQQVALDFLTSAECSANIISAEYTRVLGRAPDFDGMAFWMSGFNANRAPETLEAGILASNEFYQLQGGSPTGWLTGLYQAVLNRPVDSSGLAAWSASLLAGTPRVDVANAIIGSSEGLTDLVTQDYQGFLGRAPDAPGLSFWVGGMQSGVSDIQLISAILGSSEFYQRASLGISPPTITPDPTSPPPSTFPLTPPWPSAPPPSTPGSPSLPPDGMVMVTGISPDTGASSTDGITNSPNVTALGRGSANTAFTLYVDGAKDGSGTTNASGNFSIALSHALAQGPHYLGAVANSQSGPPSSTFSIYVDLTPPTATLSAPDFTTSTTPMVSVTASDNYSQPSTFYIDVDLKHDGSFTDPGDRNYAVGTLLGGKGQVSLRALPEGIYQVQARVDDTAGNETAVGATMQIDPNASILGSHWLRDLYNYNQSKTGGPTSGPAPKLNPNMFLYDSKGRVLVQVRSTLTKYMGDLQSELEKNLGMTVLLQEAKQNMLIGYLPINQIMNLPNQAHFSAATPVLKPKTNTGSVDTEGDKVIQADTFRANTGLDGTGVTVGVLSDSVNQFNNGLADSIKTGDLPNNVNVLEDDLAGGGTDEGRAMLEIVHDIAPGASLAFHSAFNGEQDFAQGIMDLASLAGSHVIVDDIQYADEPMFNDGIIAQAAQSVHDAGVFYATSAGNQANVAWSGAWNPASATVGTVTDTFENFGTASSPNVIQKFTMQPNGQIVLSFQWDAAFLEGGSPLPNYQVPNDLAVLVTDGTTNTVLATFDDNNKNTDMAWEFVAFANPNNAVTTFGLAFEMHNASTDPNPTTLRWVNFNGDDPQAQFEGGATSFGHQVVPGAVAVGAVPWFDPNTPESFTAQGGPVQINFDLNGNRIAPEIRSTLPQVAAPDGVSTSFFGDPYTPTNQAHAFFGTSAAAPHVAGAAALLLQGSPTALPDDVLLHLEDTAIDVGVPGFDNLTGFGRIIVTGEVAGQNQNGDLFEPNESSTSPSLMGVLNPGTLMIEGLSVTTHANGLPDYDWYEWTAGDSGTVTAQIREAGNKLELHLFTVNSANTLVELGSTSTPQRGFLSLAAQFTLGEPIFVEVKGLETSPGVWGQGSYTMFMTLA